MKRLWKQLAKLLFGEDRPERYRAYQVVTCGQCEGTGRTCSPILRNGRQIFATMKCPQCGGSGKFRLTHADARNFNRECEL